MQLFCHGPTTFCRCRGWCSFKPPASRSMVLCVGNIPSPSTLQPMRRRMDPNTGGARTTIPPHTMLYAASLPSWKPRWEQLCPPWDAVGTSWGPHLPARKHRGRSSGCLLGRRGPVLQRSMSVVTPASEPALPDAPRGAKTANLYNNVSKSNKMVPGPGHNLFTTYPPHARFAVRNTR